MFVDFFHHIIYPFEYAQGKQVCKIILKFLYNKKTLQFSAAFLTIMFLYYCTSTPWKVILKSSSPPVVEPN